jgi:tetratricopeptide (TPR) repeat protein
MKASANIRLPFLMATTVALGLVSVNARAANDARASTTAPQNQASVAQLNEEGAALYSARDYRHAIEKFIQAYAIDTDPNLLFNIARCYEELGDIDAAIEKYETFLKTPGADTRGRQRARESLQSLRDSRDHAKADEATPQSSATPAPVSGDAPSASVDSNHDGSQGSHALPWITLGGSVAFAAVGTTLYLLGASDHNQVTDAQGYGDASAVSSMTRREADDLVSSGDTKKLLGGISLGVAGALAVTYVVLLVTDDQSSPEATPSLAFSLWPSEHGAALAAHGSF